MSQEKLIKTEEVDLDAATAQWLLTELDDFVADRKTDKSHVAFLMSEMKTGEFKPEITTLATARYDGRQYRINGQHTSKAVLQMQAEQPGFAIPGVRLLTYEVDSDEVLRLLYSRFDRGRSRSGSNVIDSLLLGTPQFEGVKAQVLRLLAAGLALRKHGEKPSYRLYTGAAAAMDVIGADLKLSQKLATFFDGLNTQTHKHMFRAPVMAAMYETYEVDEGDAEVFWVAVTTGLGLTDENEPAARLRAALQENTILSRGGRKAISRDQMYRVCIQAWNMFRANDVFTRKISPSTAKKRPVAR